MQRAIGILLLGVTAVIAWPAAAAAQSLPSCKTKMEVTPSAQEMPRTDPSAPKAYSVKPDALNSYVTIICDNAQLFADEVEVYPDEHLVKARGHVTFIEGAQRITAERLEFNTKTKLGTFWNAQGIMSIAGKVDPKASMLGSTEADAYFYGEKIEKIGPDKYRLTNGKLTTCVQPTPRWEFAASSYVIVKDRYAVMRNAVLRVKDVPVLYVPWMRYPINKEDRATGFLMPSYGRDVLRGHTFSSAFFWAINRSQDATLHYEASSKAGKGYGGEYRYIQAPGSDGSARVSVFNGSSKDTTLLFTSRTYKLDANMTQRLPGRLQLRGVVDYTNDIRTQQVTQQSLYSSTSSGRSAAVNLRGGYGRVLIDAETGFNDVFYTPTEGTRAGNAPRVGLQLSQSPIGQSKIYVGATSDFTAMVRQDKIGDPLTNRNLRRVDFNPTIRAPIGSLPFFSLTASAGYRYTTWSHQIAKSTGRQIPGALHRQLFDFRADVAGPTFTRIFDTPGSRYAIRWKHVVQPTFSIQKTTMFLERDLVPKNDFIDQIVGGVTSMAYGLTNRLLAKRPTASGNAVAHEVASIQLQQTYYSDAAAASFDTSYQSSTFANTINKFSPVSLTASVQPTSGANVGARIEYDTKFKAVRSTSVGVGVNTAPLNLTANWSKQDQLTASATTGATIRTPAYHAITTSATLRTFDRRFSGTWSWSYDVQHKRQLQQRVTAAYLAQCCGVAIEYQYFNLGGLQVTGVQQNKRFNISFSLAGIGTFSNLLGSFGR